MRFHRILLDPQGGEGGNGTTTTHADDAPKGDDDGDRRVKAEDFIRKRGDAASAVLALMNETHDLRSKNASLRERLPKDGDLILSGDDAKAWAAYRQLGDPKTLADSIEAGKAAAGRAAELEADATRRRAAEIHYPGKAGTLALITKADGLALVVDDDFMGKDGKAVPTALVVAQGADGKETRTPLPEYVEARHPELLPALKPSGFVPGAPVRQVATPNGHAPASRPQAPAFVGRVL